MTVFLFFWLIFKSSCYVTMLNYSSHFFLSGGCDRGLMAKTTEEKNCLPNQSREGGQADASMHRTTCYRIVLSRDCPVHMRT